MYYYVEGLVARLEPGLAVIDCGGVGYACHTTQTTSAELKTDVKARLYTYLYVREDILDLYGFLTEDELSCFKLLINISGVGPKAAAAVLSAVNPAQFALAVITGNEKALTAAAGIGKRLAQRIILELKDKLSKEQSEGALSGGFTPSPSVPGGVSEAMEALMVLGYSQGEAARALNGLESEGISTEDMIRRALSRLMK